MQLVLGMVVCLSPGDFVLDGDPAPLSPKGGGASSPIFGPCLLRPIGWMDQHATWHEGRSQSRRFCVRWGPSPLPQRGWSPSPIFGPFLLWPNGWMHQDATSWYGGRPQTRGLWVRWGSSPPPSQKGGGGRGRVPQFSAHVYCGHGLSS